MAIFPGLRLRLLAALATVLWLPACSTYLPLNEGARVPWAQALAGGRGGPVGADRYRVEAGDSLARIALRQGMSPESLAEANNIPPPYVIYPGEVLRLPGARPGIDLATASQGPPAGSVGAGGILAQDLSAPAGRDAPAKPAGERYVVGQGDSLASIAARHHQSLGALIAANEIEPPYRVYEGQVLTLPASERQQLAKAALSRADQSAAQDVASPLPPPRSQRGFLWPVRGEVIEAFGTSAAGRRQDGIAIAASTGTPVRAADNGVVVYAGEALRGYGQMMLIRHADGYVSAYAHNSALLAAEGQVVRRGEVIARVGDSGDVARSQLHFELRRGTKPIDPMTVLVEDRRTLASG